MKRIPKKEIAIKFKEGYSMRALAVWYAHYFPGMNRVARERAIADIIRQYMRK